MKRLIGFVVLFLTLGGLINAQSDKKPEKINVDELVTKHIASIGSTENIAAAKSRVMVGEGTLTSKLGSVFSLGGTAQLASKGNNMLYAMIFDSPVYPYEKVAFDGNDQSLGLPNGKRTMLTDYLRTQSSIVKEGLFSGALSSAWTLLDLKSKKGARLEYSGLKKIDDIQCHKVKYSSSKTGDLKIYLYFDAATFRHIRSEYEYTIEPRIGTSPTDVRSSSRVEHYLLTEDFSDFKIAGNLTLPFTYKISIANEQQIDTGATSRSWTITIQQVYYNENLGSEVFKVS